MCISRPEDFTIPDYFGAYRRVLEHERHSGQGKGTLNALSLQSRGAARRNDELSNSSLRSSIHGQMDVRRVLIDLGSSCDIMYAHLSQTL
ncbi:hypothetical protein L195_g059316 [Trifolium pratense]|uniref:Uncharacterized protein n=1 Tax=Trifolium pratense TaxID=57577 RepID=A0A2K3JX94_TRIPR|nr:hypothetical protein L195_g059316 [Trifolium pratense]